MKILEAQAAVLSNYEVYTYVKDQRQKYRAAQRRGPGNYEYIVRETIRYLESPPGPLSEDPIPYTKESVAQLVERLRPWNLTKGELLIILNLRPKTALELNSMIEQAGERFTYDEQWALVAAIAEVLGPHNAEEQNGAEEVNGGADGDDAMEDAAS